MKRLPVTFIGLIFGLTLTTALLPSVALASPPPAQVSAFDCFREWDANDNYRNEGWVAAKIVEFQGVFLGCGDQSSGMIHIAHPDTTGSLHPVYRATYQDFLYCFQNIVGLGTRRDDPGFPQTRTRIRFGYGNGHFGEAIIDKGPVKFVWTMYTDYLSEGNDWAGCSGGGAFKSSS